MKPDEGPDFGARRRKLAGALARAGIDCTCFRDEEGRRDSAVRYLTGHPADAVLVVSVDGFSVLAAWDVNLAERLAEADRILPYGDFGRTLRGALERLVPALAPCPRPRVELPADSGHVEFLEIEGALRGCELLCSPRDGGARFIKRCRAVKDPWEIALFKRAASMTNALIDEIGAGVREGRFAAEADLALFIERRSRELGCEGTGFETLCAGPGRSFGIHAFPPWTAGPFAGEGLSLVDFGLKLEGYSTDVTETFLRGSPEGPAFAMAETVEEAALIIAPLLKPGAGAADLARAAHAFFAERGFSMPHALGHGIGLEAHEEPVFRDRVGNDWVLEPGMVVAVEPGLYSPGSGGVRLEDDYLITAEGAERLTRSRIFRY